MLGKRQLAWIFNRLSVPGKAYCGVILASKEYGLTKMQRKKS